MLTVVAYLISVSTAASMLSAYYIFVWDPHVTNDTKTPNMERRTMALPRMSGEYIIANPENRHYSGNKSGSNNMYLNVIFRGCNFHETF